MSIECSGEADEGPHAEARSRSFGTRGSPGQAERRERDPERFPHGYKRLGERQSLIFLDTVDFACDVWNVAAIL